MHRLYWLVLAGTLAALSFAGCGATTTIIATNDATPTVTGAVDTSTPSANPTATNTPTSGNGNPSPTKTPVPTATSGNNCGSITTSATNTTPSNPQPLEDCFTSAFQMCTEASIDVTFIDATSTTEDKMHTGPGCNGAVIQQHKHMVSGGTTTDTNQQITCNALVPSGTKYSLRECSDNEWIYFP